MRNILSDWIDAAKSALGLAGTQLELAKDDYDAAPCLHNLRLASYEWGAGEMQFSPFAALKSEIFRRGIVELDCGIITLETRRDLSCLIAFTHEHRHFQQDYSTGLGHWDFVARINKIVDTFSLSINFSDAHVVDQIPAYLLPHVKKDSQIILNAPEQGEVDLISNYLESVGISSDIAGLFTTRRLLEMDAVLFTYMKLTSIPFSSKIGKDNLTPLRPLFSYTAMPSIYTETIICCIHSMLGKVVTDEPLGKRVDEILRTIQFLLSLSFAHPDPNTLSASRQGRDDYIPGVRFLRMMQALADWFRSPLPTPASARELEYEVLKLCTFPYLTYLEIGDGWTAYFDHMPYDVFPGITAARKSVMQQKYNTGSRTEERTKIIYSDAIGGGPVSGVLSYDVPLFMRRSDGAPMKLLLTGRVFSDPMYNFDRLRSILAWRIEQFVVGKRNSVSCPLWKSAYCDAQTDRCARPFTRLSDLPETRDCRFRCTCFPSDRQKMTF